MLDRAPHLLPAVALLVGTLAGTFATLGGCSRSPSIGNPCALATPGAAVEEVTVSTPALECDGRICLQVGPASAMCSATCGNDDDCRELASSAVDQCHRGFECRAVSPFGPAPCQRLCVCKDAPPVAAGCDGTP